MGIWKKMALIAITVVSFSLSGCGLTDTGGSSSFVVANRYACNTKATAIMSTAWDRIVQANMPIELSKLDGKSDAVAEWDRVMRERNSFAGIGTQMIDGKRVLYIPRRCVHGEKPSKAK